MTRKNKKSTQAPVEQEPMREEVIEGEIVDEGPQSEPASSPPPVEGVPEAEYNQLMQDLAQAQTQAKDNFDGWQRERADFSNYRRRVERDQQAMTHQITGEVIKKYLAVLDDLDRAMKARPTEGAAATWSNGIELIYRKLQNILEAEGVQRIPAETEEFNPNRHEAISYEDSPDHESGGIIEVVQQGYTLGDRVIRPALVRVARG
jgi:molecular chaperone GrpE